MIFEPSKFVSALFTYLVDHMHENNAQFILLKIPPHFVRLLGKIHTLTIEVLRKTNTKMFVEKNISVSSKTRRTLLDPDIAQHKTLNVLLIYI